MMNSAAVRTAYRALQVAALALCWNTVSSDTPGYVTIGVLGLPEVVSYARDAAATCSHRDQIRIDAIDVQSLDGATILEKSENFKKRLVDKETQYSTVIGPLEDAVVMVTENLGIPYLATETNYHGNARNIYYVMPDYGDVIKCVMDFVDVYKWTSLGVLWQNQAGARALSGFLETAHIDLRMFRLHDNHTTDDIRDILHALRTLNIRNLLLLTPQNNTWHVMNVAKRLGMLTVPYSWIIINHGQLDEMDVLLSDLQTNVTAIHVMQHWTRDQLTSLRLRNIRPILAHAVVQAVTLVCDVMTTSTTLVTSQILMETLDRGGGELYMKFDSGGRRTDYTWDIYSHVNYQLTKIAQWMKLSPGGTMSTRLVFEPAPENIYTPHWSTQVTRVVTIEEPPWVMKKTGNCSGNDCFSGFVVDMMAELAVLDIFDPPINYEIYLVPDGQFGSVDNDTGEWNGIMGQIMSGNATISLAPLSINHRREEAVDFTKPFKTRGIKVLIKTPESHASFFQFLDPLSYQVWGMILLAMVVVGFTLGIYEKFGTRQRQDFRPITGQESYWFVFGTLMQEGTEVSPVTIAGRILTASWWFFAMILISSYTANLAAFLTVKKINTPIETVSDLVLQTKIKYGTVKNSGVLSFFRTTQIEPYRTMNLKMGPENLVNNTAEGLERVMRGNYAFFWDNTVTSYIADTDCNFTEVGPSFDPKGFGIGVPTGATYRENLTLAVLSLQDKGRLDFLQEKWWSGGDCPTLNESSKKAEETEELALENVAGIFFILVGGIVLGMIVCLADRYLSIWLAKRKQKQQQNHNSTMEDRMQGQLPYRHSMNNTRF